MDLEEKIEEDLKRAMKERNEIVVATLRLLKSAIKNKEIELRGQKKELTEDMLIKVIQSESKKRKDSIEAFQLGGREDLANREKAELLILEKYLPEQLSEEEIKNIIKEVIKEKGEVNEKDFGPVMKEVVIRVRGKSEGGIVSRLVKEALLK